MMADDDLEALFRRVCDRLNRDARPHPPDAAVIDGLCRDRDVVQQDRSLARALKGYTVTHMDMTSPYRTLMVLVLANLQPGPFVVMVSKNRLGLIADREYLRGERVTVYAGSDPEHLNEGASDYLISVPGIPVSVDGFYGFKLREKGRWLRGVKQGECTVLMRYVEGRLRVLCLDRVGKGQ